MLDLGVCLSLGFLISKVGVLISGDGESTVMGKLAFLHQTMVMVAIFPRINPWSFLHQVWDEQLARAAEAWATQCIWAHGPSQLTKYVGQNLSVHSGR